MAIEAIGGVSGTANTAAINRAEEPSGAARAPESKDSTAKDSTVVISRVTRTKDDGSTETITTYADGHTKIETTPPKFSAAESQGGQGYGTGGDTGPGGGQAQLRPGEGRVTAVDILA
jgi:hypothetical protein